MRLRIKDINGIEITEGMNVKVTMLDNLRNEITLRKGKIKYIADDVASYGCGFAIVDDKEMVTLLSTIAKSKTKIEVIKGDSLEGS